MLLMPFSFLSCFSTIGLQLMQYIPIILNDAFSIDSSNYDVINRIFIFGISYGRKLIKKFSDKYLTTADSMPSKLRILRSLPVYPVIETKPRTFYPSLFIINPSMLSKLKHNPQAGLVVVPCSSLNQSNPALF